MKVPILIPLGRGSQCGNNELRLLLRSIEKNARDVGDIYIITDSAPAWLKNVIVVPFGDLYPTNKDANLHCKILNTISKYDIDDFVFCSDDNVFTNPISLKDIPRLVNLKPREQFDVTKKWQRRVINTLEFCDDFTGVRFQHHFDVHCPQLFHGRKLLEKMNGVDYISLPGLIIYTTWRCVTDDWRDCKMQGAWKETAESVEEVKMLFFDKPFLGYNDKGFLDGGLRQQLYDRFPKKSKYEK